ncbi:ATPase [Exophiala aquamarina CBS 119918]|uniref:ATPase n=1 Tax=Exophiala aquamarina CBS 119918 TaxID=1182545 RepID=A0A072PA54_9EURO|nr:ATPase [Exophiala aquamarina CBS 119918]KEF52450.1 ATPase [Exophiala aquamarina CBS 119918]
MPLRPVQMSRHGISRPFTVPTNDLRSPEDNMTLFQWMTVSWMAPLIKIGNARQINEEDVWLLGYEFQHRYLHDAFRELRGSVVQRLLIANWIDLALLTLLAILELAANFAAPVILQKLLQAMELIATDKRPAITFAALMLAARLVAAQSSVFSLWFGRRCYERSRGEMITMLYEKTLNRKIVGSKLEQQTLVVANTSTTEPASETDPLLDRNVMRKPSMGEKVRRFAKSLKLKLISPVTPHSKEEKSSASMGKILNLMRNDVYEVAQRFWEFQTLINKPLGLCFSIYLIWMMLGWACLVGVTVVITAQILNYLLARILVGWEKKRRRAVDVKLQRISQYVEAIRHLRWYGWHFSWLESIMTARQRELNLRVVVYLWNTAIKFVNSLASGMLPVATFYAYTAIAGQELRVDVAFPAIQLFAMLQTNLREIPALITVLLNASVAVGRISDFIAEPEKPNDFAQGSSIDEERLELQDASFSWPGFAALSLHQINLTFPRGLTVIYGKVAAGKTALLQALLGELDLRAGNLIKPHTAIGYCAQTPWLQNMTIRENIVFISPYDDARYKRTLEACALLPDLANFKHGDLTSIGENGIGLSGGQKARVALARAVYSQAQVLLLDDPLSALDQQTAEWISTKCIAGPLMEDRTVVLVTHRIDICRHHALQLVEISHGSAIVHQTSENISNPSSTAVTFADTEQETDPRIDESTAVPDKFIEEERRVHGGVQLAVYWQYIKAGKLKWWFMVILSASLCRLLYVAESWFLKEWGEAYNHIKEYAILLQQIASEAHTPRNPISKLFERFPDPAADVNPWLMGFLIIILCETVGLILSDLFMLVVTYTAAKRMFHDIMARISGATFRFYDTTPIGRLMNRLTSDVGTIDGPIATQILVVIWYSISWVSSMIVIASITPVFLIFAISLTLVFVRIFLEFLPTSQSLRRLEMVSLSPLMANFGALLNGLMTVRAFCAQHQFQERTIQVTDAFQKMDHFYWSLQAWLMYRFDTLSGISTFVLTLLAIFSNLTPGLTAFVLVAANKFVQYTHAICKQYGQLQLEFVSVERVVELLHIEQEPTGTILPPASWPTYGSDVIFENVSVRYQPQMDRALSDVSVCFTGGTTNAITGRTGSGKSTLALSLLATIPLESGRILIDGIDINKVDKQVLRSRITFLAQEPVLFPGSLRHNLDPMEDYSDLACLEVIARVCGKYGWTLGTQIDEVGRNLSQGQRQLVGLARAILRRSAVVIMDEATASIDMETSAEIQRILREELKGSTIITIAHRAAAVENNEFCLVLSEGRVLQQGKSTELRS